MTTEDKKQVFQDDMVVEFRWEDSNKKGWQWVPIRVRFDKTAEYQRKGKITCNAYTTAEGVWRSINKPIHESMITTGLNIPDTINDNIFIVFGFQDNACYALKLKKDSLNIKLYNWHERVSTVLDTLYESGNN